MNEKNKILQSCINRPDTKSVSTKNDLINRFKMTELSHIYETVH